jgi:hypothetical protein
MAYSTIPHEVKAQTDKPANCSPTKVPRASSATIQIVILKISRTPSSSVLDPTTPARKTIGNPLRLIGRYIIDALRSKAMDNQRTVSTHCRSLLLHLD